MPLYLYMCPKHKEFEEIVKLSELDDIMVKCPKKGCKFETKSKNRQLTHAGEVRLVSGRGGFTGSKTAKVVHKRVGS